MKFIRSLIESSSRIINLGSQNYPRRLPKDFKPVRLEDSLNDVSDRPQKKSFADAADPFSKPPHSQTARSDSRSYRFENSALPSYYEDAMQEALAQTPKPVSLSADGIGKILVAKGIIKPADLMSAMERKKLEPGKYLGQILAEMGMPQSKIMNRIYYGNKRKKLGEILVELKFISNQQLYETLIEQRHLKEKGKHVYLAKLMINNRIISEAHYLTALSAHFSMPVVSLKDYTVIPFLQKTVGERYALRNRIVVLNDGEDEVAVAIAEPHLSVFDHLEKAVPRGKYVLFNIARASEIESCLQNTYGYENL